MLFHAGSRGFGSLLYTAVLISYIPHSKRTAGVPDDVSHNIIILTYLPHESYITRARIDKYTGNIISSG